MNRWTSVVRHVIWGSPGVYSIYRRFRFKDQSGLVQPCTYWVGGYPRSANTFTAQCLSVASGGEPVAHHLHTPPQIREALNSGKPGILLIREPAPAVISWSLHHGQSLAACLDYYMDFHRFLEPIREELFIATFQQATRRMQELLARFQKGFDVDLQSVEISEPYVRERFEEIAVRWQEVHGNLDEMQVPWPSSVRREKSRHLEEVLARSPRLQRRLAEASEIYGHFLRPNRFAPPAMAPGRLGADTTQLLA